MTTFTAVTGQQVRDAVLKAGITSIPHHDCGGCGEWVHYFVCEGNLFFSPACGCSWAPSEPRNWSDAANWINMQSNPDWQVKLRQMFGIEVSEGGAA